MADKKNINELIALIERNKIATGQNWSAKVADGNIHEEKEEEAEEEVDEVEDYSDTNLIIFAAEGPFTQSLLPMLDQQDEIYYVVTDEPDKVIDITSSNPRIRFVMLDMDRPTNPANCVNVFMELKMLNPGMQVFYCTKNPMTVEARNIQNKGAKLIQKPVLRKTLDQFVQENFKT
ncbi:MAG: hypothetical protein FWB85_11060 [Chitinispirillia bacterium]|nr:hypothetical protein [Chitinispirillia bacterium]MCL2242687.1 hypothetical protein [Chitinispirillia bacterium]